jgi:YidC/Oxa1 family membrane protein insertase
MIQAPSMDQTQRRVLLLAPLVFVILIIHFPAGLILYWITTNIWTVGPAVGDPQENRAGSARRPARSHPRARRPSRPAQGDRRPRRSR